MKFIKIIFIISSIIFSKTALSQPVDIPGIGRAVQNASRAVPGTDPAFLMAVMSRESGFKPGTKSSESTATGWYQFIDKTWIIIVYRYGAKHGRVLEASKIKVSTLGIPFVDKYWMPHILDLRNDIEFSSLMAAEILRDDKITIEKILQRRISKAESYLTHYLGAQAAVEFIENDENIENYKEIENDIDKKIKVSELYLLDQNKKSKIVMAQFKYIFEYLQIILFIG